MGKIADFYINKNVLITGATGFCGKALVEKLLRACEDVNQIYVLAREKRNETTQQRLRNYLNESIFDHLKRTKPQQLEKIVFIDGDISTDDMNLGYQDQSELIQKVHIIFHCAATVNFNDPIKVAINTNVLGLKRIANFALEVKNLQSFVYMSTAFSHCNKSALDESHHSTGLDLSNILKEIYSLDSDGLTKFQEKILEDTKYPNTYSLSKGLSEDVAESYRDILPLAVVRPSIVSNALESPIEGWIDGIHSGATGIIAGSMTGLSRSMYCGKETLCHFTPVNFVSNATIVAAYKRAVATSEDVLYFNCVDSKENQLSWSRSIELLNKINKKHVPKNNLVWYPHLDVTSNYFYHIICIFLFQLLPAILYDFMRALQGKKKFMFKLQKKIKRGISILYFFTTRDFDFNTTKLSEMFNELDDEDKIIFNFDHKSLDWEKAVDLYCMGVRKFLLKEGPETETEAQRKLKMLRFVDIAVKVLTVALIVVLVF